MTEKDGPGSLYSLLRPLLFALPPECSHQLALHALAWLQRLPGGLATLRAACARHIPDLPVEAMGLSFPNPVGLAAGLDKDACCAHAFAALGFGFLELGTVTPRPQPGNPRPRLFRLTRRHALINRMGFNSAGLEGYRRHLARRPRHVVIGANLGKNADTPLERALDDYRAGLTAVAGLADYAAINISSPNTPGLRRLQEAGALDTLLAGIVRQRDALVGETGRPLPLALKIAPDLEDAEIETVATAVLAHGIEAVIATNTTITRPGCAGEPLAREDGGLSGAPLRALSTGVLRKLYRHLAGRVTLIGAGGILSADDAWEKLVAGADLVQLYTGLIYRGPGLVGEIVRGLHERVRELGTPDLGAALRKARAAWSP